MGDQSVIQEKQSGSEVLGSDQSVEIVTQSHDAVNENEKTDVGIPQLNIESEISDIAKAYQNFDPQIHASNEDGTPKFRADGSYQKKRGRKPGQQNKSEENASQTLDADKERPVISDLPTPQTVSGNVSDAPKVVDYSALGKMYAGLFCGAATSIIGPEWQPSSKEEKKNLEDAFTAYAKSKGISDLPPGWALLFTIGVYGSARVKHENTRSKFGAIMQKVKIGIAWLKGRMGR